MYYLSLKKDKFDILLKKLEFEEEKPEPGLRCFGDNPRISVLEVLEKQIGNYRLLMNVDLGTWCFLSNEEYEIYKRLGDIDFEEAAGMIPLSLRDRLEELVFHLYIRGILSINGSGFIDKSLFDSGPVSTVNPLFIIVPTERCNLLCRYCFAASDNKKHGKMSMETADRIIETIASSDFSMCTLEFAGGEPFLEFELIKDIVLKAKEKLEASGKKVHFSIQSNATLVNDKILEFIRDNNIHMGFSLDGYEAANNETRRYYDGRGTYRDIVNTIEMFRDERVPCGVILVLSKKNGGKLLDILEHFKNMGLTRTKINPVFNLGRANETWDELALEPEDYLEIHRNYLDYVAKNDIPVVDDNTEFLMKNLCSVVRSYRCMLSSCGAGANFFTFTPDGNVYPCSRFRFEKELLMGNVHENLKLDGLYKENEGLVGLHQRSVDKIDKCMTCIYQRFCEGGCSLDSYQKYGNWSSPHPWCEYYKGIYEELFGQIIRNRDFAGKISADIEIFDKELF